MSRPIAPPRPHLCLAPQAIHIGRMSGKGGAAGAAQGEGEILSVEETVWSLRLGTRNPPCNVARFEEVWVGKGDSKRKVRPAFVYTALIIRGAIPPEAKACKAVPWCVPPPCPLHV